MIDDDKKLEAFKMLDSGKKLADISMDLGIPYTTVANLKKEFKASRANNTVAKLFDAKRVVIERVANSVQDDFDVISGGDFDTIETIEGEVREAVKAIDGLQVLNENVQATAMKLVQRVHYLTDLLSDAKEVSLLADSITKIQQAFFNKSGTYVQINNDNTSPLGEFKQLMKD